ncbi:MAG: PIN domain-containing protein [Candidatus ainarchaeum sp.]|nr:PIN domain-containing protein [Candidatus ainarchaeum sp.]
MRIYLDTCIWLNIFNKNEKNEEFNESKKLIEKLLFEKKFDIFYSGFILKEMQFKLSETEFLKKRDFFRNEKIIFLKATNEDYNLARKFEIDNNYKISFFDYLHTSICINNNLILITRDKKLLVFTKTKIIALKPIELLQRINFL